jgi:hypothetical protein
MFYARSGGPAAVPPYSADPTNKNQWEIEQKRHQHRLSRLRKEPKAIDQKQPDSFVDVSLHRGRERSRAQVEQTWHEHVGQQNRKLLGALHEIAKKPCVTLRRIESEPGILPPITTGPNMDAVRRRKQQAIALENEKIVKRLLNIKTTFDRKKDEKQYTRHKRAVQDMAKVPPPGGFKRKGVVLPPIRPQALPSVDEESGIFVPLASLNKQSSNKPLARCRSEPVVVANRQPLKKALAPPIEKLASQECSEDVTGDENPLQRQSLAEALEASSADATVDLPEALQASSPEGGMDGVPNLQQADEAPAMSSPSNVISMAAVPSGPEEGAELAECTDLGADKEQEEVAAPVEDDRDNDESWSRAALASPLPELFRTTTSFWSFGKVHSVHSPGAGSDLTGDICDEVASNVVQALAALKDVPDPIPSPPAFSNTLQTEKSLWTVCSAGDLAAGYSSFNLTAFADGFIAGLEPIDSCLSPGPDSHEAEEEKKAQFLNAEEDKNEQARLAQAAFAAILSPKAMSLSQEGFSAGPKAPSSCSSSCSSSRSSSRSPSRSVARLPTSPALRAEAGEKEQELKAEEDKKEQARLAQAVPSTLTRRVTDLQDEARETVLRSMKTENFDAALDKLAQVAAEEEAKAGKSPAELEENFR